MFSPEERRRNPIEWLFHMALMFLGTVIAFTVALAYLETIWPWLVAIALVLGIPALLLLIAHNKRRHW